MKKNLNGGQRIFRPKFKAGISEHQTKASRHSAITVLVDAPYELDKMSGTVIVYY